MDDFNFYLKFAKPLVLNLPDAKDRAIAALWVKKLRDLQSDGPEANMRIEYLKLLLFVMQRNKLAGIFEKPPPEGSLEGFPPNYKVPRTFRKEIPGFESRPSWGRSRYIERLIDESPHFSADLDVSQADAMLNVVSDKTFKKATNNGPCAISANRRHVERMLDLPPCAVDPGEMKPNLGPGLYTCCPKREEIIETHTDICQSERDFYFCGKRSGLSLRGGSDSGSCCGSQNQRNKSRTSSDSRNNDASRRFKGGQRRLEAGSIFYNTDDPLDVDASIHDTTTTSKYINPKTSANFKWLEDMEHTTFSDPTEMSFAESHSNSRVRMRPFSSDTTTNDFYQLETEGCSELDEELPINEELQPEKLMPQVTRRLQSSKQYHSQRSPSFSQQPSSCYFNSRSYAQDDWEQQMGRRCGNRTMEVQEEEDGCEEEDIEPSIAVLRRRFVKSREATRGNPEMHEKSYRWKEIIDQTEPSRERSRCPKDQGRGYYCDEDDNEEIEEPRHSKNLTGQILDGDALQYTKKLLRPPKLPPSSGRVIMPISKQNRRRPKTENVQFSQPSDVKIDADESK